MALGYPRIIGLGSTGGGIRLLNTMRVKQSPRRREKARQKGLKGLARVSLFPLFSLVADFGHPRRVHGADAEVGFAAQIRA